MCEECVVPRQGYYEGTRLVLDKASCSCPCPNVIFTPKGPKCPKCDHTVRIQLTDEYEDADVYVNPKTGRPIRVESIQPWTPLYDKAFM